MQRFIPIIFFHICSRLDTTFSKRFDDSLLVSCHLPVILDLLAPTTLAYAVANTCAATTYGCCPDGTDALEYFLLNKFVCSSVFEGFRTPWMVGKKFGC